MNTDGITKAPKDKNCPYCGQAFTSSSLGRHLDLYIKSKNPKAPDGIHNVEEIRRIRGSITRRQPRGGLKRDSSAVGGSHSGSKRSPAASDTDSISAQSPGTPTEARYAGDLTKRLSPYPSHEETMGVVNALHDTGDGNAGPDTTRGPNNQRVFNRQAIKSSVEIRQRVQDALDTAKAAELALREMISSWRAAKYVFFFVFLFFNAFWVLEADAKALTDNKLTSTRCLLTSIRSRWIFRHFASSVLSLLLPCTRRLNTQLQIHGPLRRQESSRTKPSSSISRKNFGNGRSFALLR